MYHPFADLIELRVTEVRPGFSRCVLAVNDKHLNPHKVVHGAVPYALADTGMGAALYPSLSDGEICATIIESKLLVNDVLVATANGNYSIFKPNSRAI